MKKKIIAMLFVGILAVLGLPQLLSATEIQDPEAKINNVKYATFVEAAKHAKSGDTIDLLRNITIEYDLVEPIKLKPGVTLDGHAHKIYFPALRRNLPAINAVGSEDDASTLKEHIVIKNVMIDSERRILGEQWNAQRHYGMGGIKTKGYVSLDIKQVTIKNSNWTAVEIGDNAHVTIKKLITKQNGQSIKLRKNTKLDISDSSLSEYYQIETGFIEDKKTWIIF